MAFSTTDPLAISVGGSLYWGGLSGRLTITNTGSQVLRGWSLRFRTRLTSKVSPLAMRVFANEVWVASQW